ncbi:hypothetical protein [Rubrivirga sp.]|uniref:hypothetical protein n=1 Tax=Rubrivirga sp. TaxID=1885344 RepID=UPI003B52A6A6
MLPSPLTLRASGRLRPARPHGARRTVLGLGLAVVVFALGMAAVSLVVLDSVDLALLNVAGAACLGVLLMVPVLKTDYDVVEPISLVMLAVAVGVTLKPAYIAFGPPAAVDFLMLWRQEPAFLLNGAVLVLVGLAALSAGYLYALPAPRLWRTRLFGQDVWSRNRLLLIGLVAIGVAALSMVLYVDKLGITGVLQDVSRKRFYQVEGAEFERGALGYYRWGASVVGPVFLFALAWALTRRGRLGWTVVAVIAVLVAMAVVFPFFNSSRTKVLMILIEALVIWKCVRGRIPRWLVVSMGVGMLALLLVLTALRPKTGDLTDVSQVLGVDALLETTVGGRHFLDLSKTSHIVEGVPDRIGYQYGVSYVAWVFMPVPRTVWLDKPPLGAGPIIGREIFDMQRAGVPPGMIAEAYLNFGVLGVVLVPLLIGVGLRWVYETFRPVLSNAAGATVYAVVLIPVAWTTVTGGFSQMVVALFVALLPLAVIIVFVQVRKGRRPHAV